MTSDNSLDYDNVDYNDRYNDFLNSFDQSILQNDVNNIFLLEIPAERYIETNINSIKSMINYGFIGVYVSFQRPFNNISLLFKRNKIHLDRVFIIDYATGFSGEKTISHTHGMSFSQNFDVGITINAIINNLLTLDCNKKFVFIDSLTTLALHQSFFDASRFTENLIGSIKDNDIKNVSIVFNIAQDLPQKNIIENFISNSDNYIHLGVLA